MERTNWTKQHEVGLGNYPIMHPIFQGNRFYSFLPSSKSTWGTSLKKTASSTKLGPRAAKLIVPLASYPEGENHEQRFR